MSEIIYHFCYILLVKTGHKASQNSKIGGEGEGRQSFLMGGKAKIIGFSTESWEELS